MHISKHCGPRPSPHGQNGTMRPRDARLCNFFWLEPTDRRSVCSDRFLTSHGSEISVSVIEERRYRLESRKASHVDSAPYQRTLCGTSVVVFSNSNVDINKEKRVGWVGRRHSKNNATDVLYIFVCLTRRTEWMCPRLLRLCGMGFFAADATRWSCCQR